MGSGVQGYMFYSRVQKSRVANELIRIKSCKALGLDGLPIELWKRLGDMVVSWLTKQFNKIIQTRKIPYNKRGYPKLQ